MKYADASNAAVVLEIQDARHADDIGHPLSHWAGEMDMTGKLFGVIEDIENNPFLKEAVENGRRDGHNGVIVYDKNLRIVSSERQNRLTVFERDSSK